MNSKSDVAVVIPIYHEEETIVDVLNSLNGRVKEKIHVYAVLDSLDDPTISYIEYAKTLVTFPIDILIQEDTKGVIGAIKLGLYSSIEPFIVIMTADNTDDVSDLDKMVMYLRSGADYVSASRYLPGGSYSGGSSFKRFLSKTSSTLLVFTKGVGASDATNGYKAITRYFLNSISIESKKGFTYGLEFLSKIAEAGLDVAVIPTSWKDRSTGASSFKIFVWLPSYSYWFLRVLFAKSIKLFRV